MADIEPHSHASQSQSDKTTNGPLVYIAPDKIGEIRGRSVFLAGSIEMGAAEDWQRRLTDELSDIPCTIFNPRRRDWDSSWEQRKTNPHFFEQVSWELDRLDEVDVIAMYFDENTKSPITLLELGLHVQDRSKLIVCCPNKFYRKGNVEMVCESYWVEEVNTFDALVERVRERLTRD